MEFSCLLGRSYQPSGAVNGELHRHLVEDDLGRSVIAFALALLLALLVGDVAEHDARLEGMRVRLVLEDERGDHEQRVEPPARLVDGLADHVRREGTVEQLL